MVDSIQWSRRVEAVFQKVGKTISILVCMIKIFSDALFGFNIATTLLSNQDYVKLRACTILFTMFRNKCLTAVSAF